MPAADSASHPRPKAEMTVEFWSPPVARVAPAKRATALLPSRIAIALLVAAAHLLVLARITTRATAWFEGAPTDSTAVAAMSARFLPDSMERTNTAVPALANADVQSKPLQLEFIRAPSIHLAAPDLDVPVGLDASFIAPRVVPGAMPDQIPFEPNARWSAGRRTMVVLAVDVAADGSVTDVMLERGTGDSDVDSIAIAYARKMRWIPATVDGRASEIRTRLVVTMMATA